MGAFDIVSDIAWGMVDPTGLGRAAVDYVTGDDDSEAGNTAMPGSDDSKPLKAKKAFEGFDSNRFIPEDMRKKMAEEREFQDGLNRDEPDRDRDKDGYRRAGFRVGQEYTDESPEIDPDAEVDLSSPDARMAALNGFTQNYSMDGIEVNGAEADPGQNRCGATSLMAGAMLADGDKGMQAMMDMVNKDPDAAKMYGPMFADINKKLAEGGKLTQSDLHLIQSGVHDHLRHEHERMGFDPSEGVDGAVIQDKIKNDPALSKYFSDESMSVKFIDNDGDYDPNHFVLDIGEKDGRAHQVYDPYSREGGQLVTKSGQLKDYDLARRHTFTP